MSAPSGNASERGGGADGAGAPDAARLPPEQQQGLQSLKAALQDVSKKPGATVHYSAEGETPPPQIDADNIGTMAADLKARCLGRDFIVAPSADGRRVDVVERIDLPSPDAIRTDVKTGFGGHIGASVPEACKGEGGARSGGQE